MVDDDVRLLIDESGDVVGDGEGVVREVEMLLQVSESKFFDFSTF